MSEPQAPERVADAPAANWADRWSPSWFLPYARLSRWDRPIGTWLLLLPCWWGLALASASTGARPDRAALVLALAAIGGAFLMRGAGCTWNDFTDRNIDGRVARTAGRPLPSGQVTPRAALVWMAAQALLALAILLQFKPAAILIGLAGLVPAMAYPFAKRFTWWPQVFLGIAFSWGVLLFWAAVAQELPAAAWTLYAAGVFWTLFYDTIYAHQDKEDDALIGVRSTARLFGHATRTWLFGFLVAAVLLMGLAVLLAFGPSDRPLALAVALAGCWAFGWHLAWQLRRLDTENPALCLVIFRSNRDAGLLVAAAFSVAAFL
jgi:4-hydroxybenzoate polyprenyltransferase